MTPKYRIRIEIYDDEAGEVVSREDSPLSTDTDAAAQAFRVYRNFERKGRGEHEQIYYPKEEETV